MQDIGAGRSRLLPTSLAVAIAATVLEAPLASGLIDDASPIPLVVVEAPSGDAGLVAGVRLTSGRELVATLTTGSDAKFSAEKDASGVIRLRARDAHFNHALGVYGDYLLLAEEPAQLIAAGPYLVRTVAPSTGPGETLELVAPKAALSRSIARAMKSSVARWQSRALGAISDAQASHGGRPPDFADPTILVDTLSDLTAGFAGLLSSAHEARLTATFAPPMPLVRMELVPEPTGAAFELTRDLPTGNLGPLPTLPAWTDTAFLGRSATDGATPIIATWIEKLLGDRFPARDRQAVRAWLSDVSRGLGPVHAAGLFDTGGLGVYALGTEGDGDALRRAALAAPRLLRMRALAGPLSSMFGKMELSPTKPSSGSVVHLTLRFPGGASGLHPAPISIDAASAGARTAVAAGALDLAGAMRDLLKSGSVESLGQDAAIARAVERAGDQADMALVARVRTEKAPSGFVTLTIGSDRKVTWAEVGAGKDAFRLLLEALFD